MILSNNVDSFGLKHYCEEPWSYLRQGFFSCISKQTPELLSYTEGIRCLLSQGDAERLAHAVDTARLEYCNSLLIGSPNNSIKFQLKKCCKQSWQHFIITENLSRQCFFRISFKSFLHRKCLKTKLHHNLKTS